MRPSEGERKAEPESTNGGGVAGCLAVPVPTGAGLMARPEYVSTGAVDGVMFAVADIAAEAMAAPDAT